MITWGPDSPVFSHYGLSDGIRHAYYLLCSNCSSPFNTMIYLSMIPLDVEVKNKTALHFCSS